MEAAMKVSTSVWVAALASWTSRERRTPKGRAVVAAPVVAIPVAAVAATPVVVPTQEVPGEAAPAEAPAAVVPAVVAPAWFRWHAGGGPASSSPRCVAR